MPASGLEAMSGGPGIGSPNDILIALAALNPGGAFPFPGPGGSSSSGASAMPPLPLPLPMLLETVRIGLLQDVGRLLDVKLHPVLVKLDGLDAKVRGLSDKVAEVSARCPPSPPPSIYATATADASDTANVSYFDHQHKQQQPYEMENRTEQQRSHATSEQGPRSEAQGRVITEIATSLDNDDIHADHTDNIEDSSASSAADLSGAQPALHDETVPPEAASPSECVNNVHSNDGSEVIRECTEDVSNAESVGDNQ
jgi:hypothetical protein